MKSSDMTSSQVRFTAFAVDLHAFLRPAKSAGVPPNPIVDGRTENEFLIWEAGTLENTSMTRSRVLAFQIKIVAGSYYTVFRYSVHPQMTQIAQMKELSVVIDRPFGVHLRNLRTQRLWIQTALLRVI